MPKPWLDLLQAAIKPPSSIRKVALRLDYSPAVLSLVLRGVYKSSSKRLAATVMQVLGGVQCPFLGREIRREECDQYRARDVPMSNPTALQHWAACQKCPLNPALQPSIPEHHHGTKPAA